VTAVAIRNDDAQPVVTALVAVMNANRAYLSEIDGAIGDGDHGVNMSKGFTAAGERLAAAPAPRLSAALAALGETLVDGVGGSMGPLYGNFFLAMAEALGERELLDAAVFQDMLDAGLAAIQEIGSAKVGDKTLLDALVPARDAFAAATRAGKPFAAALDEMTAAAEQGRDSTRDLVARVGRASRLGERSRGALDAGATSCALILASMAKSLRALGAG
jgi:dihydroxyacetone kinase phosphoprotein-dependent L subunit